MRLTHCFDTFKEQTMKKIICPQCGEVRNYCMKETVMRYLIFNVNDEAIDATEDREVYIGTVKRCMFCDRKVKIVEE